MRRLSIAILLTLCVGVPLSFSQTAPHGFAQSGTSGPFGDEFDSTSFTAPFTLVCGHQAPNCPDAPSSTTWSLDANSSGVLRIWTQPGTEIGSTNNGRNMVLQPANPNADWTVTTQLAFPAVQNGAGYVGQSAGIIVYQDDDNFIMVDRRFPSPNGSVLDFVQESGGFTVSNSIPETGAGLLSSTIYLQIVKTGTVYQAFYSYTNQPGSYVAILPPAPTATPTLTPTFTPTGTSTVSPTATNTPTPTNTPTNTPTTPVPNGFSASYASPLVGLFAFGGTSGAAINNPIAADFAWFRVGSNPLTPGPTAVPSVTVTSTATSTGTSTPVPTNTTVPTSAPTSTSTPTATATNTSTPVPTPTPKPVHHKAKALKFKYLSIWYHVVKLGTFDHVVVQANMSTTLGIWAHVFFPSGLHDDWYKNTDRHGHWEVQFTVPKQASSKNSNRAQVSVQLWHGKQTVKDFAPFYLVK